MLKFAPCITVMVFCLLSQTSEAQSGYLGYGEKFLNSLNEAQREKALYTFDSSERYNWHFVPKKNRVGIMLGELNEVQKQYAIDLLRSHLSKKGFDKTMEIIQLELVLHEIEKRKTEDWYRNPDRYTLVFFGRPSKTAAWGWRFEGHHISFSFSTLTNKLISATPGFLGANPAIVPSGPSKGKQVLKEETDLGFKLIGALDSKQVTLATIAGETPKEIVTYITRKANIDNPEGILYSQLNKNQQQLLKQLLEVYLNRYQEKYSNNLMAEIKRADINKLRFGWAGAKSPRAGKPYYYRIHGPTIIIEYDNSQNNANHIHTVVRDLKNDFGDEQLKAHLKERHQ